MTRDAVIRMAAEAGLLRAGAGWTEPHRWGAAEIESFASLVAAHEREECAKVCDSLNEDWDNLYVESCAEAIRARGETK